MGCWGMGITQTDEYCEVYERFMEEYDEGKPVADITKDIFDEYLEQFEPDDEVLHDVYFALGKAEWMCGGISESIFKRISQIVENGENISFYRELEATEKDLKLRKKNLEKFLGGLSVPRGKIRKRKIPVEKYTPKSSAYVPLPEIQEGDVFVYEHNGKYRVFAIVERNIYTSLGQIAFVYAWRKSFEEIPTMERLMKEHVLPLGWFKGETFPDMEKLTFVENVPLLKNIACTYPGVISKDWKPATWALAKEEHLVEEYPAALCLTLEEVFAKINQLRNQE